MQSTKRPVRTWSASAIWTKDLAPVGASGAWLREAREARNDDIREDVLFSQSWGIAQGALFPLVFLSKVNMNHVMSAAEKVVLDGMAPGPRALLRLRPYVGVTERMVDVWRNATRENLLVLSGAHRTAREVVRVLSGVNKRVIPALVPLLRTEMLRAAADLRSGSTDEALLRHHTQRDVVPLAEPLADLEPQIAHRARLPPARRATEASSAAAWRRERPRPSPDL